MSENAAMTENLRFIPLTPRIGAKCTLSREEVLDPANADEIMDARDLLMWDNCGVMHRVIPYAANSGRLMHRTTLYGVERIQGVERAKEAERVH